MGSNRSALSDTVVESLADQFFEKKPISRYCKKCQRSNTCQCKMRDFYGEEAPLRFKMDANRVFSDLLQKIQQSTLETSAVELLAFIRDNLVMDSCTVTYDLHYIHNPGPDVPDTPITLRTWKSQQKSRKFWERIDYIQSNHKKWLIKPETKIYVALYVYWLSGV